MVNFDKAVLYRAPEETKNGNRMGLEKSGPVKFGAFFHHHVDPVIVCTHPAEVEGACKIAKVMIKYALLDAAADVAVAVVAVAAAAVGSS